MLQFFPALVLLFWQAQFAHADMRGLPLATQLLISAHLDREEFAPEAFLEVLSQTREPGQYQRILTPEHGSLDGAEVVSEKPRIHAQTLPEYLVVSASDRMRDGPFLS